MSNRDYYQDPNKNPYKYRRDQTKPAEATLRSPRAPLNFNEHRICPSCGKIIKVDHNFCKFCGADISSIAPIGRSDEVTRTLADTAISDPSPDVRREAVASIAEFGEFEVLGVLSYILLHDPDEEVRSEAANELGKFHHPHSLDVFASALKDKSPIVRKKAIEGLKNIKKMTKKRDDIEEKIEKPKPSEPEVEEIPIVDAEEDNGENDDDLNENPKNVNDIGENDENKSLDSSQVNDNDYYEL